MGEREENGKREREKERNTNCFLVTGLVCDSLVDREER